MAKPLELLWRAFFRGPPFILANSGPSQFAGRITINSGSATVTVSTSIVKSDSIILHDVESNTLQSSGVAAPINVMSVVDGAHFSFGYAGGETPAGDRTIMWMILNTSAPQ